MKKKLKKFQIIASAGEVSGHQVYEVMARDEAHAKELWDSGDHGECVFEELEVQSFSDVEFREAK